MSLDLSLYNSEGEEIASMNWLRNSFGLCSWAEDNAHEVWGEQPLTTLYAVSNAWAYDKGNQVNRQQFKEVVDRYWQPLKDLSPSYYFFGLPAYRQFIEPHIRSLPGRDDGVGYILDGSKYDTQGRLMIPVDAFQHPVFHLGKISTEDMKGWYQELVRFAELLQDETTSFYCSN